MFDSPEVGLCSSEVDLKIINCFWNLLTCVWPTEDLRSLMCSLRCLEIRRLPNTSFWSLTVALWTPDVGLESPEAELGSPVVRLRSSEFGHRSSELSLDSIMLFWSLRRWS